MLRMTKQIWGRWLAVLLSVAMLFTMLPATALAAGPDGAEKQITVQEVQALIDADTITADNRADVEAQLSVIDEAKLWLSDEDVNALDMTRYMAVVSALSSLDAQAVVPSDLEQVQALIDALPDAETITADNRTDVEVQLSAINEAKLWLSDEDVDALDITRYLAAVEAILALDDMAGADVPMPIAFPDELNGTGTSEEDPYQISTKEQLAALSTYVNGGGDCKGLYFRLNDDIDLKGDPWTPIGTYGRVSQAFNGTFDGNNHTISGLYINQPEGSNLGLFGYIGEGGTVKNLGVSGSVTGGNMIGGIAGYSHGTIKNCHNDAAVSGISMAGGIAGINGGGLIKNC